MPSVDYDVVAGADDGTWEAGGWFDSGVQSLWVGDYLGFKDNAFCRFTGVTIPVGATIGVNTYISLWTVLADGGADILTRIYAEDAANPVAPTSAADAEGRVKTANFAVWDNIPDADAFTDSPSVQAVIQELVDSYDYSGGAALQILHLCYSVVENAYIRADSYDINSAHAAKLHIEYTVAVGVPVQMDYYRRRRVVS